MSECRIVGFYGANVGPRRLRSEIRHLALVGSKNVGLSDCRILHGQMSDLYGFMPGVVVLVGNPTFSFVDSEWAPLDSTGETGGRPHLSFLQPGKGGARPFSLCSGKAGRPPCFLLCHEKPGPFLLWGMTGVKGKREGALFVPCENKNGRGLLLCVDCNGQRRAPSFSLRHQGKEGPPFLGFRWKKKGALLFHLKTRRAPIVPLTPKSAKVGKVPPVSFEKRQKGALPPHDVQGNRSGALLTL